MGDRAFAACEGTAQQQVQTLDVELQRLRTSRLLASVTESVERTQTALQTEISSPPRHRQLAAATISHDEAMRAVWWPRQAEMVHAVKRHGQRAVGGAAAWPRTPPSVKKTLTCNRRHR